MKAGFSTYYKRKRFLCFRNKTERFKGTEPKTKKREL